MRAPLLHASISVVVVLSFTPSIARATKPQVGPCVQVIEVTIADDEALAALVELDAQHRGMEIWSEVPRPGTVSVRADATARAAIAAAGYRYTVAVDDLQTRIDEMFAEAGEGDFFDAHRTYDQMTAFLQQLNADYPELTELYSVGQSVLGRDMWCLRIGTNMGTAPAVIYHGAQHGNEASGAMVVAYIADHLLSNYGTDGRATTLVDTVDWLLVPITNPDGYVDHDRYNAHGVDLNRNWGGPGAPSNAFSEPETAAMRDLFLAHENVRGHIDFHGYVPWLMYPWGHTSASVSDLAFFDGVTQIVADRIYAASGDLYEVGSIWDVAYPIHGDSADYSYGELNVWGFGFEVVHSQLPEICEEFLDGSLFVAEASRDCPSGSLTSNPALDCNENGLVDACERVYRPSFEHDDDLLNECEPFIATWPVDGSIVAHQPSELSGSVRYSLPPIRFTFPDPISEFDDRLFRVTTEPPGPHPFIAGATVDGRTVEITFVPPPAGPSGLQKWTTITHVPSGASVRIGYLPGDVNGDGRSSPLDVLALIDSLNGVSPRPLLSTDMDRSGVAQPADVLRLIDLLNGAFAFDVWNGAALP